MLLAEMPAVLTALGSSKWLNMSNEGGTADPRSLSSQNGDERLLFVRRKMMTHLIIPDHYDPKLSIRQTEEAIRYIRETFQDEFGKGMRLQRMSAPMFVKKSSGLNDNLDGIAQPVSFKMKDDPK
jgi:hypothetical protein